MNKGREVETYLLGLVRQSAVPVFWRSTQADSMPNNGTVFFVKSDKASFGVTAKHVYKSFEAAIAQNPGLRCQLSNSCLVDLRDRFLSQGRDSDIATFTMSPLEITDREIATIPWPPKIPTVGQSVAVGGFPGAGKRFTESGVLNFGLAHWITHVDSVNDRDISFVFPPDDQVKDLVGNGLPPRNYDYAGMSGGPMVSLMANGVISWALAGVVYECNPMLEIMKAARADLIDESGFVHS